MDTDTVSHTQVQSREDAVVLFFNRKEAKALKCFAWHTMLICNMAEV
jgi:hypothetical protein